MQDTASFRNPSPKVWRWLAIVVLAHLLLASGFALFVPPLEKLDEFIHWDYVRYLRRTGHLPDQRDPYIQAFPAEFHQPPLYYVPAALLTAGIPFSNPPMTWEPINHFGFAFILTSIPDNANGTLHDPANLRFPWQGDWRSLYILRFYSIAISAATLVPMFWLAWAVFQDEWAALGATAWLAFRPSVLSLNSTVSNDPLLLLGGTAVLAVCALLITGGVTWRRAAFLGVLLGLTALTKFTWPATAAAVPIAFALAPGLRQTWKQRLGQMTLSGGIALVLAGWWFVRNSLLYGDLIGISLGAQATRPDRPEFLPLRAAPPTWEEAGRVAWETFRRYWAHYGVVGMPDWVNLGLVGLSILLIIGLLYLLVSSQRGRGVYQPRAAAFVLLVTLFYFLQIGALFMVNEHGGQVRYVYAGFAAMSVVSHLGVLGLWSALRSARKLARPSMQRSLSALAPAAILLPLSLYGLFGVLRPAYDLPQRVSDAAELASQYTSPADVRWLDGRIRLVGFDIDPLRTQPGDMLFVTLCWQSGGPLEEALPYAIHVVDPADGKIGERNTHPGLGMYATLYWQPGEAFCDRVRVPLSESAPTPATYRVLLSYFREDTLQKVPAMLPDGSVQEVITLGEIGVLPVRWPEAGAPDYLLDGQVGIAELSLPEVTAGGDRLTVTLTWQPVIDITRDYKTFVHVVDSSGAVIAQSDSLPRNGRFPTRFWTAGAAVPDVLAVSLADVPPGTYEVWLGMYDNETLQRLSVEAVRGQRIEDDRIWVGTIEVAP